MVDPRVFSLYQSGDRVGLFRLLNGFWMVGILESLEALIPKGFVPRHDLHQADLNRAGIGVARMEAAMGAVLHKNGRVVPWEKYQSLYNTQLHTLPPNQREEIRQYYYSGSAPTDTAPDDVEMVAFEIKAALKDRADRDIEFLAQLFESDRIIDEGGASLPRRLLTILGASTDGSNNGVTHFAGIYAGCRDTGFRTEFKDPWPGKSDNQVGHFTTGIDMGFRPGQTYAMVPATLKAAAFLGTAGELQARVPELICMRLIVGHEQVADNAPNAFVEQAKSPTMEEVFRFDSALRTVTSSLGQSPAASKAALKDIRVGTGQGNSFEDLQLSLYGYRLGEMIRGKLMTDRKVVGQWIRTNIGAPAP